MLGFLGLYSVVLKSYGFLIFLSKKIGSLIVGKASCVDTEKRLEQLSRRWDEVCGGVLERQRTLKEASHHYGEFKVLTAQECDWQDKLEKKLMRSTTLAADAEEISEELDVRARFFFFISLCPVLSRTKGTWFSVRLNLLYLSVALVLSGLMGP